MISVLIPVFNDDPGTLVSALHHQLPEIGSQGEILLFDDGSDPHYREMLKKLELLPGVRVIYSPSNTGIVNARKTLAREAQNDWLLFLDADVKLLDNNFLKTYSNALQQPADVYAGGAAYPPNAPSCAQMLHWKYGTERELPSCGFKTINFLIRKDIFFRIPFPDTRYYGHEDTWMGIWFSQQKIIVSRLDNPVVHLGLEANERFLAKSSEALLNLHQLADLAGPEILRQHIRIFRVYEQVMSMRVGWLLSVFIRIFNPLIIKNLFSCKPSLLLFDLYRLEQLIRYRQMGRLND